MRPPLVTLRRRWRELALFLAALALSLLMLDTALYFTTMSRFYWRKIMVCMKDGTGGFFYYVVKDGDRHFQPRNLLYFMTTREHIDAIPDSVYAPCDNIARMQGSAPGRPKEAAIVGDSFAIGEGVTEKDSLGWTLGREFPEHNFRNFGRSGIDAITVAEIVDEKVLPEKDRIKNVIYFYNLNDIPHVWPADARLDLENVSYHDISFSSRLAGKSTLLNLVKRAFIMQTQSGRSVRVYIDIYFNPANIENTEYVLNLFDKMNTALCSKGMKLHVVIYPLLHKTVTGRYPLQPIHDFIARRCREANISCTDGAKAFDGCYLMSRLRVNPADYHPNGEANRRIARLLKRTLKLED